MLKVLIADDEERVCKLIQILADWKALDMEVVATACNGLEAIEKVEQFLPDILITDIRMPGCDGLELISRTKQSCPMLEVIVISGYAHFEYAKTSMEYGVSNYLLKPINKKELQTALERCARNCCERIRENRDLQSLDKSHREQWNQLRQSLILELIRDELTEVSRDLLESKYQFLAKEDEVRVFFLKMDSERQNESENPVLREQITEQLERMLLPLCGDCVFSFRDNTVIGILNYDRRNRAQVRKNLKSVFLLLESQHSSNSLVQFTLALGSCEPPEKLPLSFQTAASTLQERITEGTGRILEKVPEPSSLEKEMILQEYARSIGQAVELLNREMMEAAADKLKDAASGVPNVRGRELWDLVIAASELVTTQFATEDREDLQTNFQQEISNANCIDGLFAQLKALQKRVIEQKIAQRDSDRSRPLRMAKQYILQHFAEPITLEEVASATGFSVSYFSTLFKKENGEGFLKHLTQVRIDAAKTLLRETNLPITEICSQVGYQDQKHFNLMFRKNTGLTPREYRKLYG